MRLAPSLGFVLLLAPAPLHAADPSWLVLQSDEGPALHERGIHGQREVIAVADTGLDVDSCYFREQDGTLPPVNTGTPDGGLEWGNVDPARRKVIAYDFLYSCAEYPGAFGCDDPDSPEDWDSHGHGTRVAGLAAGDRGRDLLHESGDGVAPAAKLIVQDVGYVPNAPCGFPGFGCPATDLTRILEQAWRQGATVHSHQWGDRVGSYSALAGQLDAFVAAHPESVVVFHAGNTGEAGARSVTSPGLAKNAIQVGGTRDRSYDDSIVASYSARGPSGDGRIKPDLVAPAWVPAPVGDRNVETGNCGISGNSAGTSWSAPLLAGAAALVRQYYGDGFYPSGEANEADGFVPSAALVKATLIVSARRVPRIATSSGETPAAPVPSYEQGFGFPVLDRALHFAGERRTLRLVDRAADEGLVAGELVEIRLRVHAGEPFEAALVWTDPPGPALVNDLDLEIVDAEGAVHFGNAALNGPVPDRANNAEKVAFGEPAPGDWIVRVRAADIAEGRQGFALVVAGDFEPARRSARRRLVRR